MDIKKEIIELQKELDNVKDPIFIKAIKSLLVYRKKMEQPDWWNALSESEKKRHYIEHEKVLGKRFKKI